MSVHTQKTHNCAFHRCPHIKPIFPTDFDGRTIPINGTRKRNVFFRIDFILLIYSRILWSIYANRFFRVPKNNQYNMIMFKIVPFQQIEFKQF